MLFDMLSIVLSVFAATSYAPSALLDDANRTNKCISHRVVLHLIFH